MKEEHTKKEAEWSNKALEPWTSGVYPASLG
jgi:hypothetical protein